ncbi:hypothetical protein [Cellulomonas endometrii]|uniref:hypothetical protein n=1 Tax=Cellulomonas endometrii TaxID=3036301 RepID=UPI0024ACBCA9|nr:hypothetical protein [Cellulomonas endometrii]
MATLNERRGRREFGAGMLAFVVLELLGVTVLVVGVAYDSKAALGAGVVAMGVAAWLGAAEGVRYWRSR